MHTQYSITSNNIDYTILKHISCHAKYEYYIIRIRADWLWDRNAAEEFQYDILVGQTTLLDGARPPSFDI